MNKRKLRVLVLGAGFGGLEISTILSERIGDSLDLTLIDKSDSFFFGFSKLDVMFGKRYADSVKMYYHQIAKPGVRFRQETLVAIDPGKKEVTTNKGKYSADILVIALGSDYDINATPGLSEGGNEFYSFDGAVQLGNILTTFEKGNIIVGVTGFPFKCPPAPSEAALLLHDYLLQKGIRDKCKISLVVPFELPIPPSFGTSKALLAAFREKNIEYIPEIMVGAIEPGKKLAVLDDGTELPFDLFMGIPEHRVPKVVEESGLLFDEWIPVDKKNLKTKFAGVYGLGDVANMGTPKAGNFAESAACIVAESIISEFHGFESTEEHNGSGTCFVEFGEGNVARVDVDFFSGSSSSGKHYKASKKIAAEKKSYESSRKARWF